MKILTRKLVPLYATIACSITLATTHAADTIYTGGTILTINDELPRADAVAVKDNMIIAVGSSEEVLAYKKESTQMFDLDGRTLLPGFVDSHGHAVLGGLQALSANLLPPPDGDLSLIHI